MDKLNENKPIIWMYWENKKGSTVPDCINLCWKTIIANNKNDFQIKILNEQNVNDYLPNLNKNYLRYKEIAHKADYISHSLRFIYSVSSIYNFFFYIFIKKFLNIFIINTYIL